MLTKEIVTVPHCKSSKKLLMHYKLQYANLIVRKEIKMVLSNVCKTVLGQLQSEFQ